MKNIIRNRKINTTRNMPPKDMIECVMRLAKRKIRVYIIKFHPVKLTDRDFLKATGFKTKDEFLIRELHLFFFNLNSKDKIVETIRKEYPESIEQTITEADEIRNHIFYLLGSGKVKLGKEIDWHLDFRSGFRWNPQEYYLRTGKHVTLNDPSDVKVPWELSRCQHFVTLGKAYWYTDDEKYAEEFARQIESWIVQNPIELGVNWACTMDVAIRAVNWIWGYYFFCNSKTLTEEFKIKFFKSLFLHGRHIINNLEFGLIRGNHYLSDIAGLVYLGIFFQESKEGKRWLEKGLTALKEEMEFQIYEDGVDSEGSISYHRLVTELFLSTTLLCLKNGIDFPQWYMDRLEKMIEFVMYYTKPDGTAPQFGDNDDGRLHILSNYGNWNRLDHRYLLSAGAVLFNRSDFKEAAGEFHEEAFWLLGEEELRKFKTFPDCKFSLSSKAFLEGGFYIMRKDKLCMIIDCVPDDPRALSGHKHNSRLSFELFAYDKSFIIDPGAYIYTADKELRNLFRSTRYHNTVVVDSEEQNRFDKDNLFGLQLDAAVKVNKRLITDKYDFLDAEHNGYARLKNPVVHRRRIYFNKEKGYWVIKDMLTGEGGYKHKFDLYFHFAPMEIKEKDELIIKTCNKNGANIMIMPLETEGIKMEIEKGEVSYSYGRKVEAPIVKYSKVAEVPTEFVTVIATGQMLSVEEIRMNMKSLREAIKEIDVE